jgi:phenylacetate-CoA ligase
MEDYLYNLLKYYKASPAPIKKICGNLYNKIPLKFRYSDIYFDYFNLLEKSQWWNKEKILEYQWRKLKDIIHHSYENIPYYKNLFNEWDIKPNNIQNLNDFKIIPFLTKELVKKNFKLLLSKSLPKTRRLYVETGGTTGTPLGLYYKKNISRPKEEAFINILWKRIGYKIGDKLAVLRGHIIKNAERKKFCEIEPIKNRLLLSSFNMIDENLPIYIEQIKNFKPKFLHAYPSSLTVLANFMKKNSIKNLPGLKAILISSEMIYPWQLKLFSEIFECRVFPWYGLVEISALAGSCEYNNEYHVFPEYSYVELIKSDINCTDLKYPIYEIVGTTFDNYVMPLIRYRTNDYATISKKKCICGRNHIILKEIIGRKQEFFVDQTDSLITFIYGDVPLWNIKEKINAYQYIQTEPGIIYLNIEANNKFKKHDLYIIENGLKKIYPRFDFKIDIVGHIPRTENGKFRYLIQKIPIDYRHYQINEPNRSKT